MVSENLLFQGFGVVALTLGAFMLYGGYQNRRTAARVTNTERTPIADARPGDGPVEVKGTARPTDEGTLGAPIDGTEGMVVETEIEEWTSTNNGGGAWTLEHEQVETRPFLVEDDSGTALVEVPDGATVVTDRTSHTVGASDETPQGVKEHLGTIDGVSVFTHEKRRYQQGAIEPDEEVYVLAGPTGGGAGWDGPDVTLGGETRPEDVVVSDLSEDRLVSEKRSEGLRWLAFGAFASFIGIAFVLVPLLAQG